MRSSRSLGNRVSLAARWTPSGRPGARRQWSTGGRGGMVDATVSNTVEGNLVGVRLPRPYYLHTLRNPVYERGFVRSGSIEARPPETARNRCGDHSSDPQSDPHSPGNVHHHDRRPATMLVAARCDVRARDASRWIGLQRPGGHPAGSTAVQQTTPMSSTSILSGTGAGGNGCKPTSWTSVTISCAAWSRVISARAARSSITPRARRRAEPRSTESASSAKSAPSGSTRPGSRRTSSAQRWRGPICSHGAKVSPRSVDGHDILGGNLPGALEINVDELRTRFPISVIDAPKNFELEVDQRPVQLDVAPVAVTLRRVRQRRRTDREEDPGGARVIDHGRSGRRLERSSASSSRLSSASSGRAAY